MMNSVLFGIVFAVFLSRIAPGTVGLAVTGMVYVAAIREEAAQWVIRGTAMNVEGLVAPRSPHSGRSSRIRSSSPR